MFTNKYLKTRNTKKYILIAIITVFVLVPLSILLIALSKSKNISYDISTTIFGSDLPSIKTFVNKPTDLFIVKESDYKYIASTTPFMGLNTSCPHSGAHINFTNNNAPYEVEIITPVDGRITRVQPCFDLGTHDKFDVSVSFASLNGVPVSLDYSIEPFDGLRCKTNADYYKKYIKVEEGQEVKAGDVIAIMPKFSSDPKTGTHIHYNLHMNGSNGLLCPNIFSKEIVNKMSSIYMQGVCGGVPITQNTLCYMPGIGEDIVN